jgi:hypothetical protein
VRTTSTEDLMSSRRLSFVLATSLAMAALSLPAKAAESVPYDELPEPVLATVRNHVLGGQLGWVLRERDARGQYVYRVHYELRGERYVIVVGEDGQLIGRQEQ